MMLITAAADQALVMNGGEFSVSPGKPFALRVRARAPAVGATAPQVILVFGGEAETSRVRLPIASQPRDVAVAATDASGLFSLALEPGPQRIELSYEGDLGHWPAAREVPAPGVP